MPGSIQQTVILAKIEATSGTDAAPVPGTDAMLIRVTNLKAKIAQKFAARDIVRGVFGAVDQLPYTRRGEISFSVELQSSGSGMSTAATPPAWDALIQGCGFAQTTGTAPFRVEYTPVSTGLKTLTIWAYINGKVEKFAYAAGSVKLALKEGQLPAMDFTFRALVSSVAAASAPAATMTKWIRPLAVGPGNTAQLTLGCTYAAGALSGGTGYNWQELNLDAANDVQGVELVNLEQVGIYGRNPSASLVADLSGAAIATQYANMAAGTQIAFGLTHGSAVGQKMLFFVPAAAITDVDDNVSGNVMLNAMQLSLQPTVALNDELRIVCL